MESPKMSKATSVYVVKAMPANDKHNFCYLCDAAIVQVYKNAFQMFSTPNKPLLESLTSLLKRSITPDAVHSKLLCKECVKYIREYGELQKRISELKYDILIKYNYTAHKNNLEPADIEFIDSKCTAPPIETMNATRSNEVLTTPSYNIEDVNFEITSDTISNVFGDENLVTAEQSNNAGKGLAPKNKIVYIKTEKEGQDSDILTVNNIKNIMHGTSDDSQEGPFQTVILEEIDESQYQTNHQGQTTQQLIIQDKEYYTEDDTEMIELSTDSQGLPDKDGDYHTYIYHDESTEVLEEEQEAEDDGNEDITAATKTAQGATSKRSAGFTKVKVAGTAPADKIDKVLFIRDGLNYQCLLCEPITDIIYDPKTIAIHLKTDHHERVHVCDICGADFRKRNPYNEHMEEHNAELKPGGEFECDACNVVFNDPRLYRAHKKTHKAGMKIWTCKECNKNYSSKNLLFEHMNMHTGERPYKCPHCTKDFASKYTLTAHMKIHYDRKRPYECKECGKSFFSNQNLTQHERTHTGIKEYECDVCHKKFGTPHNLDVHKIVHTGHKPFICRTCGKAFARRAEIRDHERTHTGERPYKCDLCKASFAQRSNLMSHKRATHFNDKRYKCETCDRSFKRRRLLEYHIKATHTGERPYKCEVCNSTFVYPEHFKKHQRIHSGVKPFTCEVCGKAFNSRDNRNAHRYVHSDKKPYECLVCGLGFMRKPLLYAHMEAQNHLNDTIIINQPHIGEKPLKDSPNAEDSDDADEDQSNDDIVYINLREDHNLMDDDDYNAFEEEHIIDDGEINEEHLIIDGQFSNEQIGNIDGESSTNSGGEENEEHTESVFIGCADDEDDGSERLIGNDNRNSVQLVKIQVSDASGNRDTWVNLVS